MKFRATEASFRNGMGGASNSEVGGKFSYVLFGVQEDVQHPENSGVYFEYNDQRNGAVNSVKTVSIADKSVVFELKDGKSIAITCDVSPEQWNELKQGIATVFRKIEITA